jgi:hypothetical protein
MIIMGAGGAAFMMACNLWFKKIAAAKLVADNQVAAEKVVVEARAAAEKLVADNSLRNAFACRADNIVSSSFFYTLEVDLKFLLKFKHSFLYELGAKMAIFHES